MSHRTIAPLIVAASLGLALSVPVSAQPVSSSAAPASLATPISTAGVLSHEELERRLASEGVHITKMEIRDLLLFVSGYDSSQRRVKLAVDRRNGMVLAREYKLGKR